MKSPFKTLVIREIQGAIIDFRFWVVLALCVSIIPLSFYVSTRNYAQRLSDYQQEVQAYRDRTTHVSYAIAAEGVHPPSPLSIFSQGLGAKMPYKMITSRDGDYKIQYAKPDNKRDLMGEIDFAFIVVFVLSILAIVFTFSCISGDKESGVLRLLFSNPVLRRQLLMAKIIGNYVVFLVPFILSVLIALLIVYVSGLVPVFSKELLIPILVMLGISLLFILVMFNLGLWISALSRNSILSVNILLLIWIVLGLVVPKISPIIGAAIYPVESTAVFESKRALLRDNILKEQNNEEVELYETLRAQFRPNSDGHSSGWTDVNNAYDEQVKPILEKYEQQIITETEQISKDYLARCNKQNRIIGTIMRLSPISTVNTLLAEFSRTGYAEADHFIEQAKQFQATVKQEVYDKFEYKNYRSKTGSSSYVKSLGDAKAGNLPIPMLDNYQHVSAANVFQQNWTDIALLGFYCLLFFLCGFVSFLRFDVR